MRDEYDFSQSIPNPYTKNLRKQTTIRLEANVVDYFKAMSDETGMPASQCDRGIGEGRARIEGAQRHRPHSYVWIT